MNGGIDGPTGDGGGEMEATERASVRALQLNDVARRLGHKLYREPEDVDARRALVDELRERYDDLLDELADLEDDAGGTSESHPGP